MPAEYASNPATALQDSLSGSQNETNQEIIGSGVELSLDGNDVSDMVLSGLDDTLDVSYGLPGDLRGATESPSTRLGYPEYVHHPSMLAMRKHRISINTSSKTTKRYNFLVAGLGGLGKSTFCKWLLSSVNSSLESQSIESRSTEIGTLLRTETKQDATRIILTIMDTAPAYGDSMNNHQTLAKIQRYIEKQNKTYEDNELYRRPCGQELDTRIHACFYFFAPHRVTELDQAFLCRVQSNVALVPIVAKADTMTGPELALQLQKMERMSKKSSIEIFDFEEAGIDMSRAEDGEGNAQDEFHTSAFERVGESLMEASQSFSHKEKKIDAAPPVHKLPRIKNIFAIILGERSYLWGTAVEDHPFYSDTKRLYHVLFQTGSLGRLHDHADAIHEQWRRKMRKKQRRLVLLNVSLVLIVVAGLLFWGHAWMVKKKKHSEREEHARHEEPTCRQMFICG